MLSADENKQLSEVGPGKPAGELLRRFWIPFAPITELTEDQPTKFVRLLGEDLVLFRDKSGREGLIGDHCPHRGASMLYGRVEERGIACAYHGWLYDTAGSCLETPAEPADSLFHLTVKATAYPVQQHAGLFWAYMGPQPAPLIPPYDVWSRTDGHQSIAIEPVLNCNWFQVMENAADPAHTAILHQDSGDKVVPDTTRGSIDSVDGFDIYEIPYGLMKKRYYRNGSAEEHPLIFPNILRVGNCMEIRVPIDDDHTGMIRVYFEPDDAGARFTDDSPIPVEYWEPFKTPADGLHPVARFHKWFERPISNPVQDYMAWETQGIVSDRTAERLGTSDKGIVMLRELMFREMDKVQKGLDPIAIIRDPHQPMIDTNLEASIRTRTILSR